MYVLKNMCWGSNVYVYIEFKINMFLFLIKYFMLCILLKKMISVIVYLF